MRCPQCPDASLDEVQHDGVVVDVCRRCGGLWLDRDALERLRAGGPREVIDPQGPRFDVPRYREDDHLPHLRWEDEEDRGQSRRRRGSWGRLGHLID